MEEIKQSQDEQPAGTQERHWPPLSKEQRTISIREFKRLQQDEAEHRKQKEEADCQVDSQTPSTQEPAQTLTQDQGMRIVQEMVASLKGKPAVVRD